MRNRKTKFSRLLLRTLVLILAVVSPLWATDTWDGGGSDDKFSNGANWVDSSAPGTDEDLVFSVPTTAGNTRCEFDSAAASSNMGDTSITGASPTAFVLNILGKVFKPDTFKMFDRSKLDVDECVEVTEQGATEIEAAVEFDVATGECCWLKDIFLKKINAISTTLRVTGTIMANELLVSATAAAENLSLIKKNSGTVRVATTTFESGFAPVTHPARIVEFVLESGVLDTNVLYLHGGQTASRQVSMELEQNMTVRNETRMGNLPNCTSEDCNGGLIVIDIDPNKVLDVGELILGPETVLKVTGGAGGTLGELQTSTSEGASAATCSCN